METAVIVDAVRTPIGRYGGALKDVRPDDLAALVDQDAGRARNGLDPTTDRRRDPRLRQPGRRGQPQRRAHGAAAGRPARSVAGLTVNRLCGSGLEAINRCAQSIAGRSGRGLHRRRRREHDARAVRDGQARRGVPARRDEAVGYHAGLALQQPEARRAASPLQHGRDGRERGRALRHLARGSGPVRAGEPAARRARAGAGLFAQEIVPVETPGRKRGETVCVDRDEHPRPDTTLEKLAALKPAFREGGSVTAGNSSGINDGAAAVLVMSESEGARAWACARWRGSSPRRWPASTRLHGHRPGPGHAQGARPRRAARRRHRRGRAQRSLRRAVAGLHPRAGPRPRAASTPTAAPSPSAIRSAAAARAWPPRWSTRWRGAATATASPPCASASARASPRCSSAWGRCAPTLLPGLMYRGRKGTSPR